MKPCEQALRKLLTYRIRRWKEENSVLHKIPERCRNWHAGEKAALITAGRELKRGRVEQALYSLENAAYYRGRITDCR